MEAPWKAGDTASAHCPHCDDLVTAKYARRSIAMPRSRLKVRDVLVSICDTCGTVLALPRQSMAQLLEVSIGK
jgi:RNase P subunit RPR2